MSKLNCEEIVVLENLEDHRYVSDALEEAFCEKGLREFRQFILDQNANMRETHRKFILKTCARSPGAGFFEKDRSSV